MVSLSIDPPPSSRQPQQPLQTGSATMVRLADVESFDLGLPFGLVSHGSR